MSKSSINNATGAARSELWALLAPSAGTATVTVTFSASTSDAICQGSSYSGVDQTTTFRTFATNSGTGTGVSTTVTSSDANDLLIDTVLNDASSGGETNTVGTGQTQDYNLEDCVGCMRGSGSHRSGTGSNIAMTWTLSNQLDWTHIGVAMIMAGGGGPTPRIFWGD